MKKKITEFLFTASIFGILIYLGQNTYLLEWIAKRYFCFIWVPILLFWIFRQLILARWLTFGAVGGLLVGQIAEDLKWQILGLQNQAAHSSYWGVGIWFTFVIISFGLGILHTWIRIKKSQKSQKANS